MIVLPLLLSLTTAPQDWPELRGPHQDGSARSDVFSEPFELRRAWSRDLGPGYSAVVVVDGTLVGTFSDGTDDVVVALDAATGAERWRARLGPTFEGNQGSEDGPTSTPCIADGRVFAPGPRGNLLALRLEDGEVLWSVDLVARFGATLPLYGFGASPFAVGDVVYLPIGAPSGTGGAAFDPATGEVRWEHRSGWLDYQSSLRFVEEGLLLAIDAAELSLVDAATGDAYATVVHPPRAPDLSFPQVVPVGEERLLFTYENQAFLRRLDPVEERLVDSWRTRELKQCHSPPVVHGDAIYGLSGTFLVCVDLESGERLWKSREPSARGLTLVGGHLVLHASTGEVVVAEASRAGFRERARLSIGERGSYTAPSFADGRIYLRNTVGVTCVEVVPAAAREDAAPTTAEEQTLPAELAALLTDPADPDDREARLDAWWEAQELPLVEGERVHFLFRGEADDVAIVGDMARDRVLAHTLHRVTGTDLFHRSYEVVPGGLWQYVFLVDFETAVLDARNRRTQPTISVINGNPQSLDYTVPRTESLLVMPGWERPAFLDGVPDGGGRTETLRHRSDVLRTLRDLTVYLPEGYDDGEGALPVLYVLGGDNWFEHAGLAAALDALMRGACAPAIVVGLPYHVGSADRMNGDDYALAILEEVAPLVAQSYRTGGVEVALGAADDANGVLALAALAPERFRRLAVQSPYADVEDFRLLESATGAPEAVYVEHSAFELLYRDENADYALNARRLAEHFRARGCEIGGGEVPEGPGFASWSARLDEVLAFLLPPE
jgi:outer membrane protein assembly factor BamB/enterochelin esterase-like enzyme